MKLNDIKDKLDYKVKVTTFRNVDKVIMLPDYEIECLDKDIEEVLNKPIKIEKEYVSNSSSYQNLRKEDFDLAITKLKNKGIDIYEIINDDSCWYVSWKRKLTEKEILKTCQDIVDHRKIRFSSDYRTATYIARVSNDFRKDFANFNREEKLNRINNANNR